MPAVTTLLLIPLLPFLAFVLLGLGARKIREPWSGILATLLIGISVGLSVLVALAYFGGAGFIEGRFQMLMPFLYRWLDFSGWVRGGLKIEAGIILDSISVMMMLVITLVSFMVHLFSLGYMKGEERFTVYYAYLGLFSASMLGLVISSNIFQMYICWELVGVSSFLLIGFYYEKPSAVAAAKKAFIVTRFADLGFLLGILILSQQAGTMDFQTLILRLTAPESPALQSAQSLQFLGVSALTWGLALVFVGGAGKSALFPLHIWLPDAMEGPTPVSALIHAATMVVAGVFLLARLFPIYALSAPVLLECIAYVGLFSAFIAALMACVQTDIKRVLAYSTMSQIGFMIFALGVSGYGGEAGLGYTASLFHLFTHAMFKALLFLSAGAVIHYVHSNLMRDMGGLRRQLPLVHLVFLLGCLAIAGLPPFSGFFSKEAILLASWERNRLIYFMAMLISFLTAFYMFRLYFRIFWFKERAHEQHESHSSWLMNLPLIMLALATVSAGWIPFGKYVSSDGRALDMPLHLMFSIAPVCIALAGIWVAWARYSKRKPVPSISGLLNLPKQWALNKFFMDDLYLWVTRSWIFGGIGKLSHWMDKKLFNAAVDETAETTEFIASGIRPLQSGRVQQYAIYFLLGIVLLSVIFMYWIRL